MQRPVDRPRLSRVAESTVSFGKETADAADPASQVTPVPWTAPTDVARIRRGVETALEQLTAGRRAKGDRLLRQAAASLARRQDWASSAEAALALAGSMRKRGRLKEAQTVLTDARRAAAAGHHDRTLIEVAVMSGNLAIDEIRLDEAEGILSSAVASARGFGERHAIRAATFV